MKGWAQLQSRNSYRLSCNNGNNPNEKSCVIALVRKITGGGPGNVKSEDLLQYHGLKQRIV